MAKQVVAPGQEDLSALEQQTLAQGPGLSSTTLEESQRQQAYREAHPELYAYVPIDSGGGFGFGKFLGVILAVASLAIPGIGAEIGAAILEGAGITGASAAVTSGVGSAALAAASTAAQGGSAEDVLKNAASAGFASGVNLSLGGGVTGAAAGSVAGTAIKGGDVDQILTNALAAGVGAGVTGVIGPAAGTIATSLVATGGVSDQTLLNAAIAEINGFNKPGNASAQIVEGQKTETPEELLTQQILNESQKVGQNLLGGTQVATAGTGTRTDAGAGVSTTPQLTKEQQDQINSTGVYEDENGDIRNPDGSIVLRFSQTSGAGGVGAGQDTTTDADTKNRQLIATVGLNPEGTAVANTGSPNAQYSALVGSTSGPTIDLPLNYFTGKVFDSPEQKNDFELQWINLINSSPESSRPLLNAQLNDIRNASVNSSAASTTTPTSSAATGGAAAGGGLAGGGGGAPGGQTQTPSGGATGADTQFQNEILNLISGGAGNGLGANGGPGAGPLRGGGPGGSTSPTTDAGVGGGTSLVLTNVGPGAGPGAGPATGPGAGAGVTDPYAAYRVAPDTSGGGGTLPDLGQSMTAMAVPNLGGPPGGGISTVVGGGDTGTGNVVVSGGGGNTLGNLVVGGGGGNAVANVIVSGGDGNLVGNVAANVIVAGGGGNNVSNVIVTSGGANNVSNVVITDGGANNVSNVVITGGGGNNVSNIISNVVITGGGGNNVSNVIVTGGGANNVSNVSTRYPTVTSVPPTPRVKLPVISGVSPARLLADALAAYRPAGAIEGEESGKERQNVWNEKSLRLKDALGL